MAMGCWKHGTPVLRELRITAKLLRGAAHCHWQVSLRTS